MLAGCGAVGSRAALELGGTVDLLLLDSDRVQAENIGTSAYEPADVGKYKADALSGMLYRRYRRRCTAVRRRLVASPRSRAEVGPQILQDCILVLDAFDNAEARRVVFESPRLSLHAGLSVTGFGAVIWKVDYQAPKPEPGPPLCTHDLNQGLIGLTAILAAMAVRTYLETGRQVNFAISQSGLVRPF